MDYGLLLLRGVLGLALVVHGAQRMFGLFGGPGRVSATEGSFESIGLRPGKALSTFAALAELGAGWMLVFGLATPLGSALAIAALLVAVAHRDVGPFGRAEPALPLLLAAVAAALAFSGAGRFSVDAALDLGASGVGWGLAALGLGLLGALPALTGRRHRRATA